METQRITKRITAKLILAITSQPSYYSLNININKDQILVSVNFKEVYTKAKEDVTQKLEYLKRHNYLQSYKFLPSPDTTYLSLVIYY